MNMAIEETLKSWLEQDGITATVNTGLSAEQIASDSRPCLCPLRTQITAWDRSRW